MEQAALCLHGNLRISTGLASHHSRTTDALLSVFFYSWKWKMLTVHGVSMVRIHIHLGLKENTGFLL